MSWTPRRRPDLRMTPATRPEGACWQVRWAASPQVLWFGPLEHAVLMACDGKRDVGRVCDAVGARSPGARAEVVELVEQLARAGLVERARSGPEILVDHAFRLERDARLWGQVVSRRIDAVALDPAAVREAATSDCEACRLPCCSYEISLFEREAPEVLAAAGAAGLTPRQLVGARARDLPGAVHLATTEAGECVAYRGGGCAIHAAGGLEAKPVSCQLYPAIPVLTPAGLRLGLRAGCAHPGITTDPAAVADYRRVLARMREVAGPLAVLVAPAQVRVGGDAVVPWETWEAWETEALERVARAAHARGALDALVASAVETFGLTPPAPTPERTRVLAGTLSTLVRECGGPGVADTLVALASGDPAPAAPRVPPPIVEAALRALLPLRYETALAGLGVLRLLVAGADRDPRAADQPAETGARWIRRTIIEPVRGPLARTAAATLEALAVDPTL